jgi:hypothetical protein
MHTATIVASIASSSLLAYSQQSGSLSWHPRPPPEGLAAGTGTVQLPRASPLGTTILQVCRQSSNYILLHMNSVISCSDITNYQFFHILCYRS